MTKTYRILSLMAIILANYFCITKIHNDAFLIDYVISIVLTYPVMIYLLLTDKLDRFVVKEGHEGKVRARYFLILFVFMLVFISAESLAYYTRGYYIMLLNLVFIVMLPLESMYRSMNKNL